MSQIEETGSKPLHSAALETLGLLVDIFWGPGPADCESLLTQRIPHLMARVKEQSPAWAGPLQEMAKLPAQDSADFCEHLETEYVSLFVNSPTGSYVPPYASCHTEGDSFMGKATQDMQDRLLALGLAMDERAKEPPDHLAVECEYLYFLLEQGLAGDSHALKQAMSFSEQTMHPWVARYREQLARSMEGRSPESRLFLLAVDVLLGILETLSSRQPS